MASPDSVDPIVVPDVPARPRSFPPRSGQSGPPINLVGAKLNDNEKRVLKTLEEDVNPLSLISIAMRTFPELDPKQGNSWVRNSLRRLVRGGWVVRLGPGTYHLTDAGRTREGVPVADVA